jgi:hypothetical protein
MKYAQDEPGQEDQPVRRFNFASAKVHQLAKLVYSSTFGGKW